jgi:protein phosphatase
MVDIPLHSLVILVGTVGSGKQSWAEQNFPSQELLSAESIRKELFGRADNYQHDGVVWRELYRRAELKISLGSRAVVVATNLKKGDRDPFAKMAADYGVPCFFVKFQKDTYTKTEILKQRGLTESQAQALLSKQEQTLKSNSKSLVCDPASRITVVGSDLVGQVTQNNTIMSHRLLVVGDVHGDFHSMQRAVDMADRELRTIVWLGDVIDYGDQNLKCVRLAYDTVMTNRAVFVWGNHERKIARWINDDWGQLYRGRISEANLCTIREIEKLNGERRKRFLAAWMALENQSQQCWIVNNWMFTHGAATPQMWKGHSQHRLNNPDGEMAFFGQTDRLAPTRGDGYPNRIWDWVASVPPNHNVVVGHDWVDRDNNSIVIKTNSQGGKVYCVDAGNSKGGRLAALAIDTEKQQVEERYFDT